MQPKKSKTPDIAPPSMIYLSARDLAKRFSVSPAAVWGWTSREGFPQPIRFTAGCSRWRLSDVQAWEASRG